MKNKAQASQLITLQQDNAADHKIVCAGTISAQRDLYVPSLSDRERLYRPPNEDRIRGLS